MHSPLYLVRDGETAWSFAVDFRLNQWRNRPRLPPTVAGVAVRVIHPDEEVMIARSARRLVELAGRPTSATSVKREGHEND